MKTVYLGSVVVPNGYSGDICTLFLCYDPESQKTLSVHPGGFFNSAVPAAADSEEAIKLIESHPSCRNMKNLSFRNRKATEFVN